MRVASTPPSVRAATIAASDLPSGTDFVDLGFASVYANRNTDYGLVSLSTVPEPGTLALMGVGLAGLGWKRRSRA